MFVVKMTKFMSKNGFNLFILHAFQKGIKKDNSFVSAYTREISIAVWWPFRAIHDENAIATKTRAVKQIVNSIPQGIVFKRLKFVKNWSDEARINPHHCDCEEA